MPIAPASRIAQNEFNTNSVEHSKRTLLKAAGLTLVGALFLPKISFAKLLTCPARTLNLYHLHTGESLRSTYFEDGRYHAEGLAEINHFLRDFRTNSTVKMDKDLIDLLFAISQQVGTKNPFHIVSAYRSPQTNAKLRRSSKGVAKHSYHTKGQAIDIRFPKVALKSIQKAALSLQAGGVGYYGGSDFVHVDTGPVRKWSG